MSDGHHEKNFTQQIVDDARAGYEFVPLLGSGISANSGIPIGGGLSDWLLPYTYAVVEKGWDPRKKSWEDLKVELPPNTDDWMKGLIDDYGTIGWSRSLGLHAIGSLPDWRTALEFLARVIPKQGQDGKEGPHRMTIGPASHDVIDVAFHCLVNGRKPNFAHHMLAQLAVALRIRTILTTNFDSLTEDAFEQLEMPLTRFEVPQQTGLPSPQLVHQHRSIVKLHGGVFGLRADLSLDLPPTQEDKDAFIGYFRSSPSGKPRRLLVLGVGGNDRRILKLIRAVADHYREEDAFRVYWVNHTDTTEHAALAEIGEGVVKIREQRPLDLFLFDLYQKCYGSPPAVAERYSSVIRVPPHPYGSDSYAQTGINTSFYESCFLEDGEKLEKMATSDDPNRSISFASGLAGVSSIAALAYHSISADSNFHCSWIDLDICLDVCDLKVHFLESLANLTGDLDSLYPLPDVGRDEVFLSLVDELFKRGVSVFVCFLYAREGMGCNAGWRERRSLDCSQCSWSEDQKRSLYSLLEKVRDGMGTKIRFTVVGKDSADCLAPRAEYWEPDEKSLKEDAAGILGRAQAAIERQVANDNGELYSLFHEDEKRLIPRFLYAMTLFRRARYRSALSSWALLKAPWPLSVGNDNDEWRMQTAEKFLAEFRRCGLFKVQSGGFIWMHDDVRFGLRESIEAGGFCEFEGVSPGDWNEVASECHQGIADWYVKLFRSSGDSHAIEEAVYHWLCCCEKSKRLHDRWLTALRELRVSLDLAGPQLLAKGWHDGSFEMLDAVALTCEVNRLEPAEIGVAKIQLKLRCLLLCLGLGRESSDFSAYQKYLNRLESFYLACDRSRSVLQKIVPTWLRNFKKHKSPQQKIAKRGIAIEDGRSGVIPIRAPDFSSGKKELEREWVVCATNLRAYRSAGRRLGEFLDSVGCNLGFGDGSAEVEKIRVSSVREHADRCAATRDSEDLENAIRALRRLLLLKIVEAEAMRLSWRGDKVGIEREARVKAKLQEGELVYVFSTALMRYTVDSSFLQKENAFLRTHCGLLLGMLGRFKEADRRLNEANAYLSRSFPAAAGIAWALVDIRRAQLRLLEAETLIQHEADEAKSAAGTRAEALVRDAKDILNRACRRLQGKGQNIWWWTEIYYLLLRAAALRRRQLGVGWTPIPSEECAAWFRKGSRLVRTDLHRHALLMNAYMNAVGKPEEPGFLWTERLVELLEEREKVEAEYPDLAMDENIRTFVKAVIERSKNFPVWTV